MTNNNDFQVIQAELMALQELEHLLGKKFEIVKEFSYAMKMSVIKRNQKVLGIDLSSCGVISLPESIRNIKSLETLWLSKNKLTELPKSIP